MPGHTSRSPTPCTSPGSGAQDPHPHLARLRAEAPVAWNETLGYWALTRHAECHEVSTEPARFSSKKGILTLEIGIEYDSPPTMMHTDPPEHTAYRKQVQPAFKPSLMKALVPVAQESAGRPDRRHPRRRAGRLRPAGVGPVPAADHQ